MGSFRIGIRWSCRVGFEGRTIESAGRREAKEWVFGTVVRVALFAFAVAVDVPFFFFFFYLTFIFPVFMFVVAFFALFFLNMLIDYVHSQDLTLFIIVFDFEGLDGREARAGSAVAVAFVAEAGNAVGGDVGLVRVPEYVVDPEGRAGRGA